MDYHPYWQTNYDFTSTYFIVGTHWLWEIVSMLINKTSEYDKKAKEVTMMEFRTKEELDEISSPRLERERAL